MILHREQIKIEANQSISAKLIVKFNLILAKRINTILFLENGLSIYFWTGLRLKCLKF